MMDSRSILKEKPAGFVYKTVYRCEGWKSCHYGDRWLWRTAWLLMCYVGDVLDVTVEG